MGTADRYRPAELVTVVDRLPATVRNKALTGGVGEWLEQLPSLLAGLERLWSITIDTPHDSTPGGGTPNRHATEALVVGVRLADGGPAILKVVVPHHERALDEITTLELAAGRGCVRLLDGDRSAGALLLERLGPPMVELGLPLTRRLEILTSLAEQVWRPAPACGLVTGAEKGRLLIERIEELWPLLGQPCTRAAVDHAVACAGQRIAAHRPERAMLLHGDVHQWNALADGTGFKLVDPDGLVAEPAYDLGVLLREDPVELLVGNPRDRAVSLAKQTGHDDEAIWQWGVVERVATGLIATRIGLQPVGRQMLAAADRIAADFR